jgi:hypothetical protein
VDLYVPTEQAILAKIILENETTFS